MSYNNVALDVAAGMLEDFALDATTITDRLSDLYGTNPIDDENREFYQAAAWVLKNAMGMKHSGVTRHLGKAYDRVAKLISDFEQTLTEHGVRDEFVNKVETWQRPITEYEFQTARWLYERGLSPEDAHAKSDIDHASLVRYWNTWQDDSVFDPHSKVVPIADRDPEKTKALQEALQKGLTPKDAAKEVGFGQSAAMSLAQMWGYIPPKHTNGRMPDEKIHEILETQLRGMNMEEAAEYASVGTSAIQRYWQEHGVRGICDRNATDALRFTDVDGIARAVKFPRPMGQVGMEYVVAEDGPLDERIANSFSSPKEAIDVLYSRNCLSVERLSQLIGYEMDDIVETLQPTRVVAGDRTYVTPAGLETLGMQLSKKITVSRPPLSAMETQKEETEDDEMPKELTAFGVAQWEAARARQLSLAEERRLFRKYKDLNVEVQRETGIDGDSLVAFAYLIQEGVYDSCTFGDRTWGLSSLQGEIRRALPYVREQKEIEETIIAGHMGTITQRGLHFARKVMTTTDISYKEIANTCIQLAKMGALHSLRKFDPDVGTQFKTFARWWIDHVVDRYAGTELATVHRPEYLRQTNNEIRRERYRRWMEELDTSDEAVAAALGLGSEVFQEALWIHNKPSSLNRSISSDDGRTERICFVRNRRNEVKEHEQRDLQFKIRTLLHQASDYDAVLSTRERNMLVKHYGIEGEEQTFTEIGAGVVTKGAISAQHQKALQKIRDSSYKDRFAELLAQV